MKFQGTWTDAHDAALRDYLANGHYFSHISAEINREFGTHFSRNACIGRAKRLGLCKPMQRRERAKTAPIRRGITGKKDFSAAPRSRAEITGIPRIAPAAIPVGSIASRVTQAIRAKAKQAGFPEPDMRPLRCVEIEPKHLTIMDLTHETCRFPYGGWPTNAPITFCGHWCPADEPYCDQHQALAVGRVSDAPSLERAP